VQPLVVRDEDAAPLDPRQIAEELHHVVGTGRVKVRGRLVREAGLEQERGGALVRLRPGYAGNV
jgi:hypothetical protein